MYTCMQMHLDMQYLKIAKSTDLLYGELSSYKLALPEI